MRRRIRPPSLVALLAAMLAPVVCRGQGALPPAAYSVGATYDSAHGRLVVFGGYLSGQYIGDTWEWDESAWTKSAKPGPSARNGPALVYDAKRGRVLMYGGDARPTGDLGDMWERVGDEWRRLAMATPPARTTHVMVYDARRDRVVLFGGVAGGEALGDTWEFDGDRWARVASDGPAARGLYAMAYDPARGVTVLFGGTTAPRPDTPPLGDTWEWDGRRWTHIDIAGPSPRDHTQMIFDPGRGAVVLHGGGAGDAGATETWTYDGHAWTRAPFAGPSRRFAKMVFDVRARAVMLYGGFADQPSNELWRLGDSSWVRVAPPAVPVGGQ